MMATSATPSALWAVVRVGLEVDLTPQAPEPDDTVAVGERHEPGFSVPVTPPHSDPVQHDPLLTLVSSLLQANREIG